MQSFLCSANEALAIQDDAVSKLNSGTTVCSAQQRRLTESWERLQWEIQRLAHLRRRQGICVIATCLNERYLTKLECFREAAYLLPSEDRDGMATRLYHECIAARDAFVSHVKLHKCDSHAET